MVILCRGFGAFGGDACYVENIENLYHKGPEKRVLFIELVQIFWQLKNTKTICKHVDFIICKGIALDLWQLGRRNNTAWARNCAGIEEVPGTGEAPKPTCSFLELSLHTGQICWCKSEFKFIQVIWYTLMFIHSSQCQVPIFFITCTALKR